MVKRFVSLTHWLAPTSVSPITVVKFVTPASRRSMLTRRLVLGSPGASFAHTVTRYRKPRVILLRMFSAGPFHTAVRPVVLQAAGSAMEVLGDVGHHRAAHARPSCGRRRPAR